VAKRKVAVALSDWLLVEVDAYAQQLELSRSAVIQEATAEYLHRQRSASEATRYQAEAANALEDMRRFARERASAKEKSSLEMLRELRATGRGLG